MALVRFQDATADHCMGGKKRRNELMKELRLDIEATLAQAIFGNGYAHYGYWPDGAPENPTLLSLFEAQQAYFDLLVSRIPSDAKTILDVGSGTGENALGLIDLGYSLECLSPSEHLNALARKKLPATVQVNDCTFEEYDSDRRFDVCLFAESFHYIALEQALVQLDRYCKKHVLIFDYFRREERSDEAMTRRPYSEFRDSVEAQGVFEIVSDENMTQAIIPTFDVLDRLRADLIGPLSARVRSGFAAAFPWRAWFVERLFARKLDKIARPSGRAERFADRFEYRLILMSRSN